MWRIQVVQAGMAALACGVQVKDAVTLDPEICSNPGGVTSRADGVREEWERCGVAGELVRGIWSVHGWAGCVYSTEWISINIVETFFGRLNKGLVF
jgi:hypothetical protein